MQDPTASAAVRAGERYLKENGAFIGHASVRR